MDRAFTLPELVAVIVILGILATLGVNSFRSFIANGRQAEAKLNLKAIGDLQEAYKYAKEEYNELPDNKGVGAFTSNQCAGGDGEQMKNELGFRPNNCKNLRYGYWWDKGTKATTTDPAVPAKAYAKSTKREGKLIYPGCEKTDKWTLTIKTKEIEQKDKTTDDVIKKCE